MLRSLSIKSRILLLVAIMLLFAAAMAGGFLRAVNLADKTGVAEIETVMLNDHKARLHTATHSMALALGKALESIPDEPGKVEAIRAMIRDIRFDEDKSGYYFVYKGTVNVAHAANPDLHGKDLGGLKDANGVYSVRDLSEAAKRGGGYVNFIFPKPGKGDQPKLGYAEAIPGSPFWIGTGVYVDNVDEEKRLVHERMDSETRGYVMTALGGAAAGLLLIALPLCLLIVRGVTTPLRQTTAAAERFAAGDLDIRLDASGGDELSVLQRSFNFMAGKLKEGLDALRDKEQQAKEMAENAKDMANRAERSRSEAESAMARLLDAAGRLEGVIQAISSAAQQVGADSARLSDGADRQKRRIAETFTAVEQMSSAVLDVARTAGQAAEDARDSSKQASQGRSVAEDSVQAMRRLQERTEGLKADMARLDDQANAIGRVMGVISDIADQTNLLALNAAIEAARAGDAGRGFAVVADEVRKLAEKTMTATKDVGASVAAIQAEAKRNGQTVEEAVTAIDGAAELAGRSGEMLADILRQVQGAASQAQTIAAATEQQSAASEQISRSIEEVNAVAQETAESAASATQAMESLARQAAALRGLMEELKGVATQG